MQCCVSIKDQFKNFWQWIVDDPRGMVRFCVLFTCSIIVVFQVKFHDIQLQAENMD